MSKETVIQVENDFSHASLLELKEKITKESKTYTPWFKIALEKFLKHSYAKQF